MEKVDFWWFFSIFAWFLTVFLLLEGCYCAAVIYADFWVIFLA